MSNCEPRPPIVMGISLDSLPETDEWRTDIDESAGRYIVTEPETVFDLYDDGTNVLETVTLPATESVFTLSNKPVKLTFPETELVFTLEPCSVLLKVK